MNNLNTLLTSLLSDSSIGNDSSIGDIVQLLSSVLNQGEAVALTIPESCKSAKVKKDTLYGAINSGELKSFKIGRRRLIRPESLAAWIIERERITQQEMGFAPNTRTKRSD
jgi:excisionase family DNA binding protein